MKFVLRLIASLSLAAAAVVPAVAQDRSYNLPTLAAQRSSVQLKRSVPQDAPILTAQAPSTSIPATSKPATMTPINHPVADPISGPAASSLPESHVRLSMGALNPTPEMWFYEQMKADYNNPELVVRRRSEQAAAERKAILASQAWYGVSASRPTAHITPFMYHYSPTWASSSRTPYFWTPRTTTTIVIPTGRPYVGVTGFGGW